MARLTREEIENVKRKYGVDILWSWSRVHSYQISPFEYYLHYVKHVKEDRRDSIYASIGGTSHDILERFYTGKISYDNMIDEFDDGWLVARDITQLKFDRNDDEHDQKISDKYHANMRHFFMNHTPLTHKPAIEKFVTAKIGDNVLQGYVDCCFKGDDGCYNIIDFKTSSIYKGKKAEGECGQLVVYAIALNQMGIPFDKIKIAWNFLKYCSIQYVQKNGVVKTKESERCKIGDSIQTNARIWLKNAGYSQEEISELIEQLVDANDISVLPKEIQEKYVISDCYVYVPLTDELVNRWRDEIDSTISEILDCEKKYDETHDDSVWWDDDEQVKRESYYFATLCGYSANLHKPYKQYLDSIGVIDSFSNGGPKNKTSESEVSKVSTDSDDLSWLNDIL